DGANHCFRNALKRLIAMGPHQIDQARLAEFTEFVFRFCQAVGVGDQEISRRKLHGCLFVTEMIEESDHTSASFQLLHGTVRTHDEWREVAGVAVGEAMRCAVPKAEEHGG